PTAALAVDKVCEDQVGNCGISIVDSEWVKVENLRVRDANLHNITLLSAKDCEVANVRASSPYDKNICVLVCERLRFVGNDCRDSVYEDGICLHGPAGPHMLVINNRATGNPRYGIHVGKLTPYPVVIGNV